MELSEHRPLFEKLVSEAMDELPKDYISNLNNVAIVLEETPTQDQRTKLKLRCHDLLFGIYEGVSLDKRGTGVTMAPPDKITIFMDSLLHVSSDEADLKERIKRTLWHEIAHFYGLDHERMHNLQNGNAK